MNIEQKSGNEQYQKSSPTALLVAYGRTLTDIPFSGDVFEEYEKIRMVQGKSSMPTELQIPALAPRFEARHKLINQLLRKSGIMQVLEIAAGLSPRGLEMTENTGFTYIEVDLVENAELKRKIIDAITTKPAVGSRANLYVIDGDALNLPSLQAAAMHLDKSKPIAVITEGLLRYLNFSEKTSLVRNIHMLLEQSGGIWITSDTDLKPNWQRENIVLQRHSERKEQTNDVDTELNLFKVGGEAQRFFEELGFTVEDHSIMEVVNELVSPKWLGKSDEEIEALFSGKHIYVMKKHNLPQ